MGMQLQAMDSSNADLPICLIIVKLSNTPVHVLDPIVALVQIWPLPLHIHAATICNVGKLERFMKRLCHFVPGARSARVSQWPSWSA
jgi:hypothetical protein